MGSKSLEALVAVIAAAADWDRFPVDGISGAYIRKLPDRKDSTHRVTLEISPTTENEGFKGIFISNASKLKGVATILGNPKIGDAMKLVEEFNASQKGVEKKAEVATIQL